MTPGMTDSSNTYVQRTQEVYNFTDALTGYLEWIRHGGHYGGQLTVQNSLHAPGLITDNFLYFNTTCVQVEP